MNPNEQSAIPNANPVGATAPAATAPAATNVQGAGATKDDDKKAVKAAKKPGVISTQDSLQVSQIRDGMLIMKDGTFRAVVACESINFDLMSQTEKDGVEYSYQNFLNSLYFTTQILVRSQRVDIGPYLQRLADIRRGQDNMLLNVLMDDYMQFIDILSQEANIMDKSFYIVVQYASVESIENAVAQSKGFFKKLFSSGSADATVTKIDRATYDKAVTEINNRVDLVVNGLFQMGVHSVRLDTKELSTLFYNFYNPDTAVHEPLADFSKVTSLYVQRGEGTPPPPQEAR
ncbi:hypothetical protein FWF48_00015 [Candidatus Saccharibacteria bacterium]|nr:hypothetical protein [Candidatus Saccharibacteria bacterium]